MEDSQIIELYFKRAESAVSYTSEKYASLCGGIAYRILRNREDSEECVNDTWLKAWEHIPPVRPNSLAAFLAKITRNLSIDRLRRRTHGKKKNGTVELCLEELCECIPDERGAVSEDFVITDALNQFLQSLKPTARAVFIRRYWYVCSVKEIAVELSMTEGAVKMQLSRTRKELRQLLEQEGIEV